MFDISVDTKRAERLLTDLAKKQLPFATALALNDAAQDVRVASEAEVERAFDRPTPFTKRGLFVRRASKSRLTARVAFKDIQSKYLGLQVSGGTRRPSGRALLLPGAVRLNQYGNIAKGAVARIASKSGVFVAGRGKPGTSHLRPGIYQRGKVRRGKVAGPKLLVSFKDTARYDARLRFHPVALAEARAKFPKHLISRLRAAMATAK
jgi:hypothetical protein